MNLTWVCLLFVLSFSIEIRLHKAFTEFKLTYNRSYPTAEESAKRFHIFVNNTLLIQQHNADMSRSWKMGVNQFADLTSQEFRDVMFNTNATKKRIFQKQITDSLLNFDPPCDSVNWVKEGIVPPVQNQGYVSSPAISVASLIDTVSNQQGNTKLLSSQELIDCVGTTGLFFNYLDYVKKKGGLCSVEDYPQSSPGVCKTCSKRYGKFQDYSTISKSKSGLEEALCKESILTAIEADQTCFQFYQSGILDGDCCGANVDHAMLLVGFGQTMDTKYWTLQNTWGSSWGEQGYMRICRDCGKNNGKGQCGILVSDVILTV